MTLFGVAVGQYAVHRRQEKQEEREIEALRDALAVELRTSDDRLEHLLYVAHDLDRVRESAYGLTEEQYQEAFEHDLNAQLSLFRFAADTPHFSKTVFNSNADKIGKLDSEVAEAVIQTYGRLETLDQSLQNLKSVLNYEELVLNRDIDWSTGAGLDTEIWMAKVQLESAVSSALLDQKTTLARLGDTGTESDRAAVAFALFHTDAQSEKEGQTQDFLEKYMEEHNLASFEELVSNEGDHPMTQR